MPNLRGFEERAKFEEHLHSMVLWSWIPGVSRTHLWIPFCKKQASSEPSFMRFTTRSLIMIQRAECKSSRLLPFSPIVLALPFLKFWVLLTLCTKSLIASNQVLIHSLFLSFHPSAPVHGTFSAVSTSLLCFSVSQFPWALFFPSTETIEYGEFIALMAVSIRGCRREKLTMLFHIFDSAQLHAISRSNLQAMLASLATVAALDERSNFEDLSDARMITRLFKKMQPNADGLVTIESFIGTCIRDEYLSKLTNLIMPGVLSRDLNERLTFPDGLYQPDSDAAAIVAVKLSIGELQDLYVHFLEICPNGIATKPEDFETIFADITGSSAEVSRNYTDRVFRHLVGEQGGVLVDVFLVFLLISAASSWDKKLKMLFRIYDTNRDGKITRVELFQASLGICKCTLLKGTRHKKIEGEAMTAFLTGILEAAGASDIIDERSFLKAVSSQQVVSEIFS
eukprot:m.383886 g.383886  ORF g.383886 m.383886 type:complete len:453 (-) comp56259_c0_seq6:206-1564(-)